MKTTWLVVIALVAGCSGGGGSTRVVLSLRGTPVALGEGNAPALAFGSDGYFVAWDVADSGGSSSVRYRRIPPGGGAPDAVRTAGQGSLPRLYAAGGTVGLSWVGDAAGTDQVFFTIAQPGGPLGVMQATTLSAAGDFLAHDLARINERWIVTLCHKRVDNTGSIVLVGIDPAGPRAPVEVAPVRCKEVTTFVDGLALWIVTTEEVAGGGQTVFARRVDAAGVSLGGAIAMSPAGATGAGQAFALTDASALLYHDGSTERLTLQRFDRAGGLDGQPLGLDTRGPADAAYGVAFRSPGFLLAYRPTGDMMTLRAFDNAGLSNSDPLPVAATGPGAARLARSSNTLLGLTFVSSAAPPQVTFVEVQAATE